MGPVSVPIALGRADVAEYVAVLIYLYLVLIFVVVITSFLPRIPYNRFLDAFLTFANDVTRPYLGLFRRFLPLARLGPAAIDLSPMVGTFVLMLVGLGIVVPLIHG